MYKLNRIRKRIGSTILCIVAVMLAVGVTPAHASLLTIDQIIYATAAGTTVTPSLLSGTIDVTVVGNQLTVLLRNTSANGAFVGTGDRASMLLTGFGIQLAGVDILSGAVTVDGSSTTVNFDAGQSLTNISNQWAYANSSIDGYSSTAGALAVDSIVSSVNNGGSTRFAGPPPNTIDGPGYGAISALETEFAGGSTPGVRETIKFVLTLGGSGLGALSAATINAGNVVLAFGSPTGGLYNVPTGGVFTAVPEPSTYALYGLGISMLFVSGWWQRRKKQALEIE